MVQGEATKPKGPKNAKYMLIRYGRMGQMGWFEHNESHIPKTSNKAVIKTERGLELGEVVGVHNYRGGQFRSTPEQVEAYYGNPGPNSPVGLGGTFVRFATHEDLREQEHLLKSESEEIECCEKYIREFNLPMRIIEAEHLFGGERIVYYFTSEGRVDFRELVKTLAREYQTRIELRQIGARDEAKLVSDYETCGQQCCCSRYLKILEPVNMRMAKLQKATLDPSKISGHCGRLKCCLRYEDQTYMELKDKLPPRNSMVRTPKGTGRVVDVQILTQLVIVQDALGDRQAWPVDELLPYDGSEPVENAAPPSKPAYSAPRPQENGFSDIEEEAQQEQDIAVAPEREEPPARTENRPERRNDRDNRRNNKNNNNRSGDNRSDRRPERPAQPQRPERTERPQNNGSSTEGGTEKTGGESRSSRRNRNRRKKRRGNNPGGQNTENRQTPNNNSNAQPSGE
jgi:cell fate regulator YaaT (PSP1 superfamily)